MKFLIKRKRFSKKKNITRIVFENRLQPFLNNIFSKGAYQDSILKNPYITWGNCDFVALSS